MNLHQRLLKANDDADGDTPRALDALEAQFDELDPVERRIVVRAGFTDRLHNALSRHVVRRTGRTAGTLPMWASIGGRRVEYPSIDLAELRLYAAKVQAAQADLDAKTEGVLADLAIYERFPLAARLRDAWDAAGIAYQIVDPEVEAAS